MKYFYTALIIVLTSYSVFSQTENMNFEEGDFDNWILEVGTRTNPNNVDWNTGTPGDVNNQIRIMNPGVPPEDEYGLQCGLNFPTVFPGGAFSARIGDTPGGRRAAKISRTFTVTPEESYLQYSYAVILQEPGHRQQDQPKFQVNIRDSNGNIVTCGQFEAFAGSNAVAQGFTQCDFSGNSRCYWPITECQANGNGFLGRDTLQILPWVSGGADLTPYLGQQITIEFIALDCMLGGHGGTAYVEANVEPLEIQVEGLCMTGPNDVTLTAPLGFTGYQWSTGETTQSITVLGAEYGDTFSVDLTANTGCNTSATITLAPVAGALIDPIPSQTICPGGFALLQPTGTDAGSFFFQDIGVTGLSAVVTPTVTTDYTVIALDENGCAGEQTVVTINVLNASGPAFPDALFEIELADTSGPNPCNSIQLNNLSDYCKDDLAYFWEFGDGTTSTDENPVHTYTNNDVRTFFITLTVTSAGDGLSDSFTLPFSTSTIAPSFFAVEDCGIVTVTNISRICNTTFDLYPDIRYEWDFGDGNSVIPSDNTVGSFDYTYATSGQYIITLNMIDDDTGTIINSLERPINVTVQAGANYSYFTDCFEVTFQDLSDACDPIQTYLWDFGDGTTSTDQNPIHTFATEGPHNVSLTIDDGTQTDTFTDIVMLDVNNVIPNFVFATNCNEVTFTDRTNSCVNLTYQWNFGDGSMVNTNENPTHIFETDEIFNVTLTVNDGTQDYSITLPVDLTNPLVYNEPMNLQECVDGTSPQFMFSLYAQADLILSNIDPNTVAFFPQVTYHLNEADAENGTNEQLYDFQANAELTTLYARVVDGNGCYKIFPFDLIINLRPQITIKDVQLCEFEGLNSNFELSNLSPQVSNGVDPTTIVYTYHNSQQDADNNLNAITSISLDAGTDYTIYVRAENTSGMNCYSVTTFMARLDNDDTLQLDEDCPLFKFILTFSNALTPNGDGSNESFIIDNVETYSSSVLTIYNRWGNRVYETTAYQNDWRGTYEGRPLPVGTYYYVLQLNNGEGIVHKGYLSIIR